MKKTNDFKLGEEFTVEWGRNDGIMHSTCNFKIDEHTLVCDSEEKVKGWHFEDKMIFSKLGMINEKYFKEEDIRAKKYYEKVGVPHGKFSRYVLHAVTKIFNVIVVSDGLIKHVLALLVRECTKSRNSQMRIHHFQVMRIRHFHWMMIHHFLMTRMDYFRMMKMINPFLDNTLAIFFFSLL